jgi:hypothetical protein
MGSSIITLHDGYVAFVLASRSNQPMDFRENDITKEIQQGKLGCIRCPTIRPGYVTIDKIYFILLADSIAIVLEAPILVTPTLSYRTFRDPGTLRTR